jgi:hypothetical protein
LILVHRRIKWIQVPEIVDQGSNGLIIERTAWETTPGKSILSRGDPRADDSRSSGSGGNPRPRQATTEFFKFRNPDEKE